MRAVRVVGLTALVLIAIPTAAQAASLALVVQPGAVALAYRPVDPSTMTFDHLWWNVQRNGTWGTAVELGQLASSWERLSYTPDRNEVATRMADGQVHLFTLS
jgi:hypothetical protein